MQEVTQNETRATTRLYLITPPALELDRFAEELQEALAGGDVASLQLRATAIKVNPGSPQRPVRAEALRRGITVFVPTPRLRGGFKKLDPRRIPADRIDAAASLSRGDAGQRRPSRRHRPSSSMGRASP